MKLKKGNILSEITNGVIIQQVNCQNVMGAGFAKNMMAIYPIVKTKYHEFNKNKQPNELLGCFDVIQVTPELKVINLYTQLYYGNARKTNKCYTNQQLLEQKLKEICSTFQGPITAPAYIGCGLAGGDWKHLTQELKDYDITFYALP